LLFSRLAQAESQTATAPPGHHAVARGVQAPGGMLAIRTLLHVNASENAFGEPVSLAPDIFYAVTDTLQLGIVHNGPMGWQTRPGFGLCLTGETHGCPRVYDNVGFDLMYGLAFGDVRFSIHSSLYVFRFSDPSAVMWTVGVVGKIHLGQVVALFFDPQAGVALNDRDGLNKDTLFLPLELQFQAGARVSLKLLSGVIGQLSNLGDTYQVPVGVGVVGNVTPAFDLGLRFSFDNLLGQQPAGVSRTDTRSLSLLLQFRV
jgi:hypothetical protein